MKRNFALSFLLLTSFANAAFSHEINSNCPPESTNISLQEDIKVAKVEGVTYQLRGCTNTGGSVTCSLMLTSDKDTGVFIYGDSTRIIDFEGNEYPLSDAMIGNKNRAGNGSVRNSLLKGITLKASFSFNNVPNTMDKLAILFLYTREGAIKFENVSLIQNIP